MKNKYLSLFISGLMLFAVSCKKDRAVTPSNKANLSNGLADVYAAGYIQAGTNGAVQTAAYWKNGVLTVLGDTATMFGSTARGIAVSGNDVYVSGVVYTANFGYAVVWKNGIAMKLSPDSTSSEAAGISVNGGDVYVAGFIHDIVLQNSTTTQYNSNPVYWKNGVPNRIPNATSINSIAVSGNDVYIGGAVTSGHKYNDTGYGMGSKAAYWKNGGPPDSLNSVSDDLPYYSSSIYAIAANSTGVYAIGSSAIYPPELWINDSPAALTGGTTASLATSIVANGTDVYISGSAFNNGSNNIAAYWKNNVPTFLDTDLPATPSLFSVANGIALYNNDIYAAGAASVQFATTPAFGAYVWKNGAYTKLSDRGKGAVATCIAVVAQP